MMSASMALALALNTLTATPGGDTDHAKETKTIKSVSACKSIKIEKVRLSCFEAFIDDGKSSFTYQVTAPHGQKPSRPSKPAKQPSTDKKGQSPKPVDTTPTTKPTSKPNPSTETQEIEEQFGNLKQKDALPKSISIEVVKVWAHKVSKKMRFQLSNGQVWHQVDSKRWYGPRKGSFSGEIQRQLLGSYGLKADSMKRTIKVRRIK